MEITHTQCGLSMWAGLSHWSPLCGSHLEPFMWSTARKAHFFRWVQCFLFVCLFMEWCFLTAGFTQSLKVLCIYIGLVLSNTPIMSTLSYNLNILMFSLYHIAYIAEVARECHGPPSLGLNHLLIMIIWRKSDGNLYTIFFIKTNQIIKVIKIPPLG